MTRTAVDVEDGRPEGVARTVAVWTAYGALAVVAAIGIAVSVLVWGMALVDLFDSNQSFAGAVPGVLIFLLPTSLLLLLDPVRLSDRVGRRYGWSQPGQRVVLMCWGTVVVALTTLLLAAMWGLVEEPPGQTSWANPEADTALSGALWLLAVGAGVVLLKPGPPASGAGADFPDRDGSSGRR